jgi:hypothetical protein
MHGNLPAPVATMLEKKHGCFDAQPHNLHVISGKTDLDAVTAQVTLLCTEPDRTRKITSAHDTGT